MSTITSRRLSFIHDVRSDAWIAQETGIPRSTLGFVRRGERTLPPQYRDQLRRVYQREAYGRLRDTGFSTDQARRFSWYVPERITEVRQQLEEQIDYLARGRVVQMKKRAMEAGETLDEDQALSESRDAIRSGLRKSKKPLELWVDYGR